MTGRLGRLNTAAAAALLLLISGCGGGGSGGSGGGAGGGGGGGSEGGTVLLVWEAPVSNIDGTCLEDLQGYHIRYGTAPGDYTFFLTVPADQVDCVATTQSTSCGNVHSCAYQVDDLAAEDWHFVIQAFDSTDNRSLLSNETSTSLR